MKGLLSILLLLFSSPLLFGLGQMSPVSGENRNAGHQDGSGEGALFNDPMGLARDALGNLYICDARNHVIRKISVAGVVTTVAGLPGEAGAVDGSGSVVRFRFPTDVAVAPDGTLYVADSGNHCIRKIATDGTVTTLAGDLGSADDITQDYGSTYTVVPTQLDGQGSAARFNSPGGIAYAVGGHLYVCDTGNQIIRRVDLDGTVVTIAGMPAEWGSADGTGAAARFCSPMGLCVGTDGNVYIADSHNHAIRCMTPLGVVTTFSGSALEFGCETGPRLDARYCEPTDIALHPDGGFIVCESFGHALFRVDGAGEVSMFAGSAVVQTPPAPNSLFNPNSAVCDDLGNVYVADTFNQEVRLIIAKFEIDVVPAGSNTQLTLTWDSLPGRDYQIQEFGAQGWGNAPHAPIHATSVQTSTNILVPGDLAKMYRILLIGF